MSNNKRSSGDGKVYGTANEILLHNVMRRSSTQKFSKRDMDSCGVHLCTYAASLVDRKIYANCAEH